ncbi:thioredoxin domain-containing protein [Xanthobacter pseudotagetidis]|uniref:hydrogenase n=1 Tax=Xanthobacter pseudotagetidis TaxID=3119911 RepID=UPI0037284F7A
MTTLDTPAPRAAAGTALHPLVRRLIEDRGYALAETDDALAGLDGRDHVLFLPAYGKAHLETPDIAVVLPELIAALGGAERIGGAVAGPKLEAALRDRLQLAVPALVVVRRGEAIGSVARMRDWDDYLARLGAVLDTPAPATH